MYIYKLGLKIHSINFNAQNIDDSIIKIFKMVLAYFSIKNNL